jgi:hypothetical protein
MAKTQSALRAKNGTKGKPSTGGISVITSDEYQQVPTSSITIVERPDAGEDKLFFNPRNPDSFTPEKLAELIWSLRIDGLQTPLLVRSLTSDDGSVVHALELIAGERRLTSARFIASHNLPCFSEKTPRPKRFANGADVLFRNRFGKVEDQKDKAGIVVVAFDDEKGKSVAECPYEEVYPTQPGSVMFRFIPVKVIPQCADQRALRLAYTENGQSEPLPIKDEITLIERLTMRGLKQEDIAELLNSNVTFVSQTASFRRELPAEAFSKLVNGEMVRHVAVNLLSYKFEDREALYKETIQESEQEYSEAQAKHRRERENHEDAAELHTSAANKAEAKGELSAAAQQRRKAETAESKAEKAKQREQRAQSQKGHTKTGHVERAAAKLGIERRKAKILPKEEIEANYVKGMTPYIEGTKEDPVTGQTIPADLASIARRIAQAVLQGERDPIKVIREYMFDNEIWERPPEAASAPGRKKNAQMPVVNDELDPDEDEDDEDEDQDADDAEGSFERNESDDDDVDDFGGGARTHAEYERDWN